MSFYTESQRARQDEFESRPLADALEAGIVSDALAESQAAFIESRDFFFLSTVNDRGEPTVSYKGGGVGIVTVIDETHLAFPIYDGNGMFLSVGNIDAAAQVAMLFIDFETPQRVRIQGAAAVLAANDTAADDTAAAYPGALLVVGVEVTSVFVNCARYIHPHTRRATSTYVPDADGHQPYPSWKRIDRLQGVLPPADQGKAENHGGLITERDYGAKLKAGES